MSSPIPQCSQGIESIEGLKARCPLHEGELYLGSKVVPFPEDYFLNLPSSHRYMTEHCLKLTQFPFYRGNKIYSSEVYEFALQTDWKTNEEHHANVETIVGRIRECVNFRLLGLHDEEARQRRTTKKPPEDQDMPPWLWALTFALGAMAVIGAIWVVGRVLRRGLSPNPALPEELLVALHPRAEGTRSVPDIVLAIQNLILKKRYSRDHEGAVRLYAELLQVERASGIRPDMYPPLRTLWLSPDDLAVLEGNSYFVTMDPSEVIPEGVSVFLEGFPPKKKWGDLTVEQLDGILKELPKSHIDMDPTHMTLIRDLVHKIVAAMTQIRGLDYE